MIRPSEYEVSIRKTENFNLAMIGNHNKAASLVKPRPIAITQRV